MAKILIVDDRPTNREFLVTLLGYSSHRLLEAADGSEALHLARTEQPDLVIADILMPTMDGYEFVRHLRADPAIDQTTVIFYTAHYLEREAQALAESCGVSHVLFKPSEPEEVLRIVDKALGLIPPPAEAVAPGNSPTAPELADDTFDREHLRLLTDKLSQKANESQAANQRLTALIELGQQLVLEKNPQYILEKFCHASRTIIGASFAAIGVLTEDKQSLRYFLTSGFDVETAARIGPPSLSQGIINRLLTEARPIRLRDLNGDPEAAGLTFAPGSPYHPLIHSFLGAPIASPTRLYGWLYLGNKVGAAEFSEEDERVIVTVAAQVAVAYENGRRYEKIQRHADELEKEVAERKDAETKYRTLVEQLPAITYIMAFTERKETIYISPQVESLLGFSQAEWLAEPDLWHRQLHPDDRMRVVNEIERADESGEALNIEYRLLARTGQVLWFRDQVVLIRDQSGQIHYVHGIMFDITAEKRLQEQLTQAQKMEAVGRLAGGIAHDFNNLLVVITGYSELILQRNITDSERIRTYIMEIQKAGERAARLTRQLLAFSRKQVLQPEVLNLNEVIINIDNMLRRLIGEDINLITAPAVDLGLVKADPGQVEQVIMNLAVNARDAMPQGGKLIIETANIELDQTYTRNYLEVTPGWYVMLAVSDSGTGMDAATLTHLFEPFFTTKEQGRGTGLGLATVYGIVKQSGGHMAVYSELGQGTTFKVYLPMIQETVKPLENLALPHWESLGGAETILLVEDEEGVRQLVADTLIAVGYTVLQAVNGSEALQLYTHHSGPIHMLLTDVVMPGGFNGRELAERLQLYYPTLKVLYMSGYTDDAIVHRGILESDTAFLQKPFTPGALERKVREVLNTP